MDITTLSIESIGLSVRAQNALQRAGVHTVAQMLEYNEDSLREIRNLGAKSVQEILEQIRHYQAIAAGTPLEEVPEEAPPAQAVDVNLWLEDESNQTLVLQRLEEQEVRLDVLELLSARSYNLLLFDRREFLHQIPFFSMPDLLCLPRMDEVSASEIRRHCLHYVRDHAEDFLPPPKAPESDNICAMRLMPRYQQNIARFVRENDRAIEHMGLPNRAKNQLLKNGYTRLSDIILFTELQLLRIPAMGAGSVAQILGHIEGYLKENEARLLAVCSGDESALAADTSDAKPDLFALRLMPRYQQNLARFVRENDVEIARMGLPNRAKNQLLKNGYTNLSDIILFTEKQLYRIPAMGATSVAQILEHIERYLKENEARLLAVCGGDESALLDEQTIRNRILALYESVPFGGLHLEDILQALNLPDSIDKTRIKHIIGTLLAERELEYVDYRCYRVYTPFREYLPLCTVIKERSLDILEKRLDGMTLEAIALEYGLTRERIRQIIQRDVGKIRTQYHQVTGKAWFDEDYYRYFYETYAFDKRECSQWLGIPEAVWTYLDMMDVRQGHQDLSYALEDSSGLDAGLRLKIKNYLNRNKLYLEGMWIEKRRADLEQYVARKFCTEDTAYADFIQIYNRFLEEQEIPYDEEIYYTDSQYRSRKNALASSRFLLWKQNEMLRYYDIDGRDFSQLLEELNLEVYKNIEISTLKLMRLHPEVMEQYDIRDQYELHNLLRKIIPEGSLHDFHCGRMPDIKFGTFDRDSALMELLIAHAPISLADLCERILEEYGYDPGITASLYLQPFSAYYHQGMYTIEQKVMSDKNRTRLKAALTEDFYYIDEIRKLYTSLIPGADPEEINPYNLKTMGLQVLSRYVVQNQPSLEAYFESLFTKEDIVDIKPYRERFVYVQMFYQKLLEMKRNLDVVEFEPNTLIRFRKLERSGVTKEMVAQFCQQVYDRTRDGDYFSISSLREDGFESELFDLGFSDWFYANLLLSDSRFSWAQLLNNLILYRGRENITIRSFVSHRIRCHGSVDYFDLLNELTDTFGCRVTEKRDITERLQDTEIYYDRILDRFYANAELYYRELDETGGF